MNYKQAKWKEPLLIEKSHKGRQGVSIPNTEFTDKISHIVGTNIPNKMLRKLKLLRNRKLLLKKIIILAMQDYYLLYL